MGPHSTSPSTIYAGSRSDGSANRSNCRSSRKSNFSICSNNSNSRSTLGQASRPSLPHRHPLPRAGRHQPSSRHCCRPFCPLPTARPTMVLPHQRVSNSHVTIDERPDPSLSTRTDAAYCLRSRNACHRRTSLGPSTSTHLVSSSLSTDCVMTSATSFRPPASTCPVLPSTRKRPLRQ